MDGTAQRQAGASAPNLILRYPPAGESASEIEAPLLAILNPDQATNTSARLILFTFPYPNPVPNARE